MVREFCVNGFGHFFKVFFIHGRSRLIIRKTENKTWDLTAGNVSRGIYALFRRQIHLGVLWTDFARHELGAWGGFVRPFPSLACLAESLFLALQV